MLESQYLYLSDHVLDFFSTSDLVEDLGNNLDSSCTSGVMVRVGEGGVVLSSHPEGEVDNLELG